MNKNIYIIVENIKDSKCKTLKTIINPDGYVVFNKNSLLDIIGKSSLKKLINRGLFKEKKERNNNELIPIQRLVACLYSDITGKEIHHIDKNKKDNRLNNLVPLSSETNKELEKLPREEMIKFGRLEQEKWMKEVSKPIKYTLSNNSNLLFEIISYANSDITATVREIYKKFKSKIKSLKVIRNILNYFFYFKEFINWLKENNNVCIED